MNFMDEPIQEIQISIVDHPEFTLLTKYDFQAVMLDILNELNMTQVRHVSASFEQRHSDEETDDLISLDFLFYCSDCADPEAMEALLNLYLTRIKKMVRITKRIRISGYLRIKHALPVTVDAGERTTPYIKNPDLRRIQLTIFDGGKKGRIINDEGHVDLCRQLISDFANRDCPVTDAQVHVTVKKYLTPKPPRSVYRDVAVFEIVLHSKDGDIRRFAKLLGYECLIYFPGYVDEGAEGVLIIRTPKGYLLFKQEFNGINKQ